MRLALADLNVAETAFEARVLVDGAPAFAVAGGLARGPFECVALPGQNPDAFHARVEQVKDFCANLAPFDVPEHGSTQPTLPITLRDLAIAQKYGIHPLVDARVAPGDERKRDAATHLVVRDAWSERGTRVAFELPGGARSADALREALDDYNLRITPFVGKPRYSEPELVTGRLSDLGSDVVVVRHRDLPQWAYDALQPAMSKSVAAGIGLA